MRRFADSARAAAGLACGALGWRVEDFWAATPADLLMVVEAMQAPTAALCGADLAQMMERDANG